MHDRKTEDADILVNDETLIKLQNAVEDQVGIP
jgi:hypothetical protein